MTNTHTGETFWSNNITFSFVFQYICSKIELKIELSNKLVYFIVQIGKMSNIFKFSFRLLVLLYLVMYLMDRLCCLYTLAGRRLVERDFRIGILWTQTTACLLCSKWAVPGFTIRLNNNFGTHKEDGGAESTWKKSNVRSLRRCGCLWLINWGNSTTMVDLLYIKAYVDNRCFKKHPQMEHKLVDWL